jgi:hypothetical protein
MRGRKNRRPADRLFVVRDNLGTAFYPDPITAPAALVFNFRVRSLFGLTVVRAAVAMLGAALLVGGV